MAVKGALAKKYIIDQLKIGFGSQFIGESGGKVYISAPDGNEMVQIAITLTCAKTPIDIQPTHTMSPAFGDGNVVQKAPPAPRNIEITNEEKQHIANLLEKLGL